MFTFDAAIDAIQTAKKTLVSTFVTNQTIADSLTGFVDAQTEYTKKALKAGTEAATTLASESVKVAQEMGKFDYSKFGEGIMKAYNSTSKK
jgi:hypothetical protein